LESPQRQNSKPNADNFLQPLRPHRKRRSPALLQALLSENEGYDGEQADLRFCRRVARELSNHFYASNRTVTAGEDDNPCGDLLGPECSGVKSPQTRSP